MVQLVLPVARVTGAHGEARVVVGMCGAPRIPAPSCGSGLPGETQDAHLCLRFR